MSNFLNNLVARTLNLAPVVQPRLTSRFEPLGPAATTAPADESVEAEAIAEPLATARLEQPASVTPAITPHAERDQSREVQHVSESIRHERAEIKQPRFEPVRNTLLVPPPQSLTPPEIEHLPRAEPPQRPTPQLTTAQVASEVQANTTTQKHVETKSEDWRQLEPRVQRLIDSRLSSVQPARANDRDLVKTPATVQQPGISRASARERAVPVAPIPRFDLPALFQPEPAETINVTIGRVDVRAVFSQPTTAAPTRTRPSPVNSLDDYLKQRSEGRR